MSQYTTIQNMENYLLINIAADFQDQVKAWIEAISSFIERQTGRVFVADATASYRKYEVEPKQNTFGTMPQRDLFIDECVQVSELKIDGDIVDPSEYVVYPANSLPKTRIKLKDDSGCCFTVGEQNIEVKAKWGYSVNCPNDIAFVATVLVAGIINYSLAAEGEIKSETIGTYSVAFKDEKQWQDLERAKEILESYCKIVI